MKNPPWNKGGAGGKPTPAKTFKAGATDVSFPEHVSFRRWTFGFFFSSEGLCLLVSILFACLNIGFGVVLFLLNKVSMLFLHFLFL